MGSAAFESSKTLRSIRDGSEEASGLSGHDGRHGGGPEDAAADAVSAQEISELVSGALKDVVLAMRKPCAATYLDVLEGRKRDSIVERMSELPPLQLSHPVVQSEVLKEFAMVHAQARLANAIIDVVREYAGSKRRAAMRAMT